MRCLRLAFAVSLVLLSLVRVYAFTALGWSWPSGNVSFTVDNFALTGLAGTPMTGSSEPEQVVAREMARIRETTASVFSFSISAGGTADCGFMPALGVPIDGISNITSVPCLTDGFGHFFLDAATRKVTCRPDDLVDVFVETDLSNHVIETDICFISNSTKLASGGVASGGWSTVATPASNQVDFQSYLATAFGFSLGLQVNPAATGTMMSALLFGTGQTWARYPLGDDVKGLQSIYGADASQTVHWAARNATGGLWSPLPNGTVGTGWGVSGAVGHPAYGNSTYKAVEAQLWTQNGYLSWLSTPDPVTSSSSWNWDWLGTGATYSSYAQPAVAVRNGTTSDSNWAMAITRQVNDASQCTGSNGGFTTLYSKYAFDSTHPIYASTITGVCSVQPPALVYDKTSDRFFLFFVDWQTNLIKYISAPAVTGSWLSWGSINNAGVYTPGQISATCNPASGYCALEYLESNDDWPSPVMKSFQVNSLGVITWHAPVTSTSTPATPGVITYRAADNKYTYAEITDIGFSDAANGFGAIGYLSYPFVAFSTASLSGIGDSAHHRPALLDAVDTTEQYMVYVR